MIRKLAIGFVLALVAAAGTTPAGAADFAMSVSVENPQITVNGGVGGNCDWEVLSKVRVVNLTSGPISLSAVDSYADFSGGSNGHVPATILNDAGLVAGAVLAPSVVTTFDPVTTTFTLPCSSSEGQVEFRLMSSVGTGSGDAPFLEAGTPVPMATLLGGLALTGLLAGAFTIRQRRRRPAPASV